MYPIVLMGLMRDMSLRWYFEALALHTERGSAILPGSMHGFQGEAQCTSALKDTLLMPTQCFLLYEALLW